MANSQSVVLLSVSIKAEDSYEAVLRALVEAFASDCKVDLAPFADRICGVVLQSQPLSELDELKDLGFSVTFSKANGITLQQRGPRGGVITGLHMKFTGARRTSSHLKCTVFYRRWTDSGWNVRQLLESWGWTDPLEQGAGHYMQTVYPHPSVLSTEGKIAIDASVANVTLT